MIVSPPPPFIKLLAHDLRWNILKALVMSDYRVHELVEQLGESMNLVSYHLKRMRDDELVTTRRSEADGRDVYYSLDLERLRTLYSAAGGELHPLLASDNDPVLQIRQLYGSARVLFICTHNSARSQMAEGLMRQRGGEHIEVHSAGNEPTRIHPDAVRVLSQIGVDISTQQPKHLDEYADQTFDYVITVCDRAREVCPVFPGGGQRIHWGFADPVVINDEWTRLQAFRHIAQRLESRVKYFLAAQVADPELNHHH